MTLLWRFGNVACTSPDKLDKQDDKMRAPRRVRTRGAAMKIWAKQMRRMGAKRSSSSVASCGDLRPRWNALWERSQRSSVRSPTMKQRREWRCRPYDMRQRSMARWTSSRAF